MEFLTDNDEATAEDVLVFIREAVQRYSQLKPTIVGKLLEVFPHIKSIKYVSTPSAQSQIKYHL